AIVTDLTIELTTKLDTLRNDTVPLSDATKAAILNAADRSAKTAARAVRVSWIAASSALALSILVSVPIVWSITSRLREMGKATRAVAAGQFEHRMAASGTDEFSDL